MKFQTFSLTRLCAFAIVVVCKMSVISFKPHCMKGTLISVRNQERGKLPCCFCYAEGRASLSTYDAMVIRNSFHEDINQPSNSLQDHQMYYLQDKWSSCCDRIPLNLFHIFTGYFCTLYVCKKEMVEITNIHWWNNHFKNILLQYFQN